jgi:hypothetical protein
MTVTAKEYQEEIMTWVGTKWRHQGRQRNGVDCIGLAICTAKNKGLISEDFNVTNYDRRASGYHFINEFKKVDELQQVLPLNIMQGDILVFTDGTYPCHCGIAIFKWDTIRFVHAHVGNKKVMEEAYPWPMKSSTTPAIAAFRFKELVQDG